MIFFSELPHFFLHSGASYTSTPTPDRLLLLLRSSKCAPPPSLFVHRRRRKRRLFASLNNEEDIESSGPLGPHFITEFYRRKRRPSSSSSALSSSSEMPKTTPESLKRLQNGSDVRGVALAGVENEPITITPESVFCLGCAFVDWLRETGKMCQ